MPRDKSSKNSSDWMKELPSVTIVGKPRCSEETRQLQLETARIAARAVNEWDPAPLIARLAPSVKRGSQSMKDFDGIEEVSDFLERSMGWDREGDEYWPVAEVGEMMVVDNVEQVEMSVVQEERIESDAKQPMVPPVSHLVADVDDDVPRTAAIHLVDDPRPLPYEESTVRSELQSDRPVPVGADEVLREPLHGSCGR